MKNAELLRRHAVQVSGTQPEQDEPDEADRWLAENDPEARGPLDGAAAAVSAMDAELDAALEGLDPDDDGPEELIPIIAGAEADDPSVLIPAILRARRQELRLSLRSVGEAAGINLSAVHQIERAGYSPTLRSLVSHARALGMTVTLEVTGEPIARGRDPRTHCQRGHELSVTGTYLSEGSHLCRACVQASQRRRREARRAAKAAVPVLDSSTSGSQNGGPHVGSA